MADREKVIRGLECVLDAMVKSEHVIAENGVVMSSWQDRAKRIDAIREAIALLKAQETKLVHVTVKINYQKIGECPTCGKLIDSGYYPNYCGACGQAVKWK